MRILLLRTWITNIGNGFIDKGASACVKGAFPNADIIEASGYSGYVADELALGSGLRYGISRFLGYGLERLTSTQNPTRSNMVSVADLVDADLAILPGCVLYQHALWKYMKTLEILSRKGIPLIFLGAGGGDYSIQTQTFVKDFIKRIKPKAILTRDEIAFNLYSDAVPFSYNGIDCGFFINDWYSPPASSEPFIVMNFDKGSEPALETNYRIIRPNHYPFGFPFAGRLRRKLAYNNPKNTPGMFVSDSIEDYLFVYGNSLETHADRVHACVATLAYGNPARIYASSTKVGLYEKMIGSEDRRGRLFDRVLDDDIRKGLVKASPNKIATEKENQMQALKAALESF